MEKWFSILKPFLHHSFECGKTRLFLRIHCVEFYFELGTNPCMCLCIICPCASPDGMRHFQLRASRFDSEHYTSQHRSFEALSNITGCVMFHWRGGACRAATGLAGRHNEHNAEDRTRRHGYVSKEQTPTNRNCAAVTSQRSRHNGHVTALTSLRSTRLMLAITNHET